MAKKISKQQEPAAPKRRRRMWLAPALWCAAVAVTAIAVSLTWDSAAKYFQSLEREAAVKAKEFYFTSDYLTPEGETYSLWPDENKEAKVTFELRNYDGLNISELDINYEVRVSPAVSLDKTEGSIAVNEGKETVTLSGLQAGETYQVTVTGSNGYEQVLRATFTVDAVDTRVFKNTRNYGDYVLLTIWTADAGAQVTFTVPTGLIPDGTDDALRNKTEGSEIEVELGAHESRTFRFFTTGAYAGGVIDVMDLPETTLN